MKTGTLLVYLKNKQYLDRQIPLLSHIGWKVEIATDIQDIETRTGSKRPDVVIISMDLKDQNVLGWHERISNGLGIPCLVFCESSSRTSQNDLIKSRIKDIVLPPINAHGIHNRIELLFRTRTNERIEKIRAGGLPRYSTDELRSQFITRASDKITRTASKVCTGEIELKPGLEGDRGAVMGVSFMHNDEPAYLFVTAENPIDPASLLEIVENMVRGEQQKNPPMELKLTYDEFNRWATKTGTRTITQEVNGNKLTFAIVTQTDLPKLIYSQDGGWAATNIETQLMSNTRLSFDVYVYLPQNNRYILYVRKDQVLTAEVMARIHRLKAHTCFVSKESCGEMVKYCMERKLARPQPSAAA